MNRIGVVNALDVQVEDQRESLERSRQIQPNSAPTLTEKHYAFEGDVDSDPGTVIFACKPRGGDDRFLNSGGEITHTLPVSGKDRWERRRNVSKVVQAEAQKVGLFSNSVELDFDGIFEKRWVFHKRS